MCVSRSVTSLSRYRPLWSFHNFFHKISYCRVSSVAGSFICFQNFFPRNFGKQQTLDSIHTTHISGDDGVREGKKVNIFMDLFFIMWFMWVKILSHFLSFLLSFRLLCLSSLPSFIFFRGRSERKAKICTLN